MPAPSRPNPDAKPKRRPKASHGQGGVSTTPRADGRYTASLVIDGHRYYRYARTKREALVELGKLRAAREAGTPIASERVTLGEYLAEWLDTSLGDVTPQTADRYRRAVRLYLDPQLGRHRLARLTPQQVRRAYLVLGERLSPATIAIAHAVLHSALEQATRDGLLPRNVASLVQPPAVATTAGHPLTREQARALLAAAEGDRLEALWLLLLTTGARIGELLALRWADVDIERRTLSLHGSRLHDVYEPGVYASGGKNRSSRRQVGLVAAAARALQARRQAQREERLAAGPRWVEQGEWVFTASTGRPLTYQAVLRWGWRPLAERAGLAGHTPHDLRHSVATLLLEEGIHPRVVADLLGHSTTAMTTDRYSHVTPSLQQTASDVLERLLR